MMRKFFYFLSIVLVAAMTWTSCDQVVEPQPEDNTGKDYNASANESFVENTLVDGTATRLWTEPAQPNADEALESTSEPVRLHHSRGTPEMYMLISVFLSTVHGSSFRQIGLKTSRSVSSQRMLQLIHGILNSALQCVSTSTAVRLLLLR